jgi:hypothetical protein
MATIKSTTKRLQIDKANAMMVAIVAASSFVVTFSLVASKTLWTQRTYQAKVIKAKETARNQLKANFAAASQLETSYKAFTGTSDNVLGGNPTGKGDKDGDNGKIVLDALPSKYDFPALTTSVEKMLSGGPFVLRGITGIDDELNQAANANSTKPVAIEIPFSFTAEGNFSAMKDLVAKTERSIRPISIQSMTLTGSDSKITLLVNAKTYYQPAKSLKINTEVLK